MWTSPVDYNPPYSGGSLLIHYGEAAITPANTVVVPVKTGSGDDLAIIAYNGADGSELWAWSSTYSLPPHGWVPSMNVTLIPRTNTSGGMGAAWPESGGRIAFMDSADNATSPVNVYAFYGNTAYSSNPSTFDSAVKICTPLTTGPDGAVYFGYIVLGQTPLPNLASGIARVMPNGTATFMSASRMTHDRTMAHIKQNSAPALSSNGRYLYTVVNQGDFSRGRLVMLSAGTLRPIRSVPLIDPKTGASATVDDDGTASPTVGPDGDVFVGVLETPFASNNDRGWMLHFNGTLTVQKFPGAFGWDNAASIVPASAVPFYRGTSSYLLFTKYNNYAGLGSGNGVNKIALLDPTVGQVEPVSGVRCMAEVATQVGQTPDSGFRGTYPNAVREWCVNTGVIDVPGKCALCNSEDGVLYRWDFVTNTLSENIRLNNGLGQAYTPTLIGPNGRIYAISNATLYAIGSNSRTGIHHHRGLPVIVVPRTRLKNPPVK